MASARGEAGPWPSPPELVQKEGVYQIGLEAMEILQEVLCGKGEQEPGRHPEQAGLKSIGLCSIDGGLMTARAAEGTGELVRVDSTILETFLAQDYTPVAAVARARTAARQCTASAPASLPPGWRWR